MLDLLLAARDGLYLSHTGRSVRDNSPLPPSVLVAELLDILVPAIAAEPASPASLATARRRLVVEHPLQAFSALAFAIDGDLRLRSHNHELAEALRHSLGAPGMARHGRHAPPTLDADAMATDDERDERHAADAQLPFFARTAGRARSGMAPGVAGAAGRVLPQPLPLPAAPPPGHRAAARQPTNCRTTNPSCRTAARARALARRLLPALRQGIDDAAAWRLARAGTEMPGGAIRRAATATRTRGAAELCATAARGHGRGLPAAACAARRLRAARRSLVAAGRLRRTATLGPAGLALRRQPCRRLPRSLAAAPGVVRRRTAPAPRRARAGCPPTASSASHPAPTP